MMDAAERKRALDLVDEIQEERAGTKLNLQETPKVLLPYQARWHEDPSQIRIGQKSRRIGFTWGALAAESVLEAAEAGGMDQFYMGYNLAMAAEFIGDSAFFARAFGHAASEIDVSKETVVIEDEKRDIVTYKIKLANGRKIEALSSNPYNWRGRQGHARIDEAAFHDRLAELIKGALAFLMWGGRLDVVSTHNGEDNYFWELIRSVVEGRLPWSHHKVDFDDALREGFYRRICLVRGLTWSQEAEEKFREDSYASYPAQEDANEELGCIPKKGAGAYFSRMLIERCQKDGIPILRFSKPAEFVTDDGRLEITRRWIKDVLQPALDAMPTECRTAFGQDFGRDGDLSVMWPLQERGLEWRTPLLVELRRIPFDCQQLILFHILDALPLLHHAKFDARGNGQSHAEAALQRYGHTKVECVMASPKWYGEHFPPYRRAYEDRSIIVPKSEDVIADHRRVVLRKGVPGMDDGRDKGSDGEFRHGDSAIAGLLAWTAAREESTTPWAPVIWPSDIGQVPGAIEEGWIPQ